MSVDVKIDRRVIMEDFGKMIDGMDGYEQVKDKLGVRVYNVDYDMRILDDTVYDMVCDLAVVPCVVGGAGTFGRYVIPVKKSMLEVWGVSKEQVMSDAKAREERRSPGMLERMDSFISSDADLYVCTNKDMFYGAAALFYPGMIEKILGKVGDRFWILPSSVHEFLIMPCNDWCAADELREMVRQINRSEVKEKDRLSDEVYLYDAGEIVFA